MTPGRGRDLLYRAVGAQGLSGHLERHARPARSEERGRPSRSSISSTRRGSARAARGRARRARRLRLHRRASARTRPGPRPDRRAAGLARGRARSRRQRRRGAAHLDAGEPGRALVVPTDEELMIARHTLALVGGRPDLASRPAGARHAADQSARAAASRVSSPSPTSSARGSSRSSTRGSRSSPTTRSRRCGERLAGASTMTPVVSAGIDMMGPMESAFRSARLLGATTIRLGLSPVLCGDRNACGRALGRARRAHPRGAWRNGGRAPTTRATARRSRTTRTSPAPSWSRLCETEPRRRHHLRHRQHLPGGRGAARLHPAGRAARPARAPQGLPRAVHRRGLPAGALRDRRRGGAASPRCWRSSPSTTPELTAVLEPGALEARHVRLFTPDWWNGYAPKTARGVRGLPARGAGEPPAGRTPTTARRGSGGEDDALEAYELDMIRRSAANMRALGIMAIGEDRWRGTERQDRVRHRLGARPRPGDGRAAGRAGGGRGDPRPRPAQPAKYGEFADLDEVARRSAGTARGSRPSPATSATARRWRR